MEKKDIYNPIQYYLSTSKFFISIWYFKFKNFQFGALECLWYTKSVLLLIYSLNSQLGKVSCTLRKKKWYNGHLGPIETL